MNLQKYLSKIVTNSIRRLFNKDCQTVLSVSRAADYQFNQSFEIANSANITPAEVAEKIANHIDVENIEVWASSGFVNIKLSKKFLEKELLKFTTVPPSVVPKNIILDFSSPNMAKVMHIGHLRSTIIGDTLARLFEFLGHNVSRISHVGDFGPQIGMLISLLKKEKSYDLNNVTDYYKQAKAKFDSDPQFKKEAQLETIALQQGKEDSIYQEIIQKSRDEFQKIYNYLDIKIEEKGESFYRPYLKEVVEDCGKLIEVVENSKCVFLKNFKNKEGGRLPLIVQKKDGGYNYATTDLAAFKYRGKIANKIIVVTDAGQKLHFDMVSTLAKKLGYLKNTQFEHITFGLVLKEDGTRFQTRSGDNVNLLDVIDRSIEKATKLAQERSIKNYKKVGFTLGVGSIKYGDLSCNRNKNYKFSYDKILKFEGNTITYILYALVRIKSVERSANVKIDKSNKKFNLQEKEEMALGLQIVRFHEVLEDMEKDLCPHKLTDYLFCLTEKFHKFFYHCRIIDSEQPVYRLSLCWEVKNIVETTLQILGISSLDSM